MSRVYVVDVRLPGGQRIAAYVEADSYQAALAIARLRYPEASCAAFPGTASHDDVLCPEDVIEPSAPAADDDITYPGRPHSVFVDQHKRDRAADS